MRLMRFALSLSSLVVLSLTGCHQTQMQPLPGTASPAYTITDLGAGTPHDINNRGQVVGHFSAGVFPNSNGFPYFHGCLWDKGKRIDMPTLGGWYSDAARIDGRGHILGTASVAGRTSLGLPIEHLCRWDGHKLTNLDADSRFQGTSAIHITQSGAVYAASPPQEPKKQSHLWLYPAGFGPGAKRDVGIIGGPKIKPLFINDSGMVVGTWDTGQVRNKMSLHHAFVWHRGDRKWQDIGTFGGIESEPTGLNNADQVIGETWLPDAPYIYQPRVHAFLWEMGKMQDLGTLPGGYVSYPNAINSKGQIVGYSDSKNGHLGGRPILWEHGQIKDLAQLIPSGTRWINMDGAEGINDRGQIVGDGSIANPTDHYAHGYLLTPR